MTSHVTGEGGDWSAVVALAESDMDFRAASDDDYSVTSASSSDEDDEDDEDDYSVTEASSSDEDENNGEGGTVTSPQRDALSDYEQQRLKQIEANNKVLSLLGLADGIVPKSEPAKKRSRIVRNDFPVEIRRSARNVGVPAPNYVEVNVEQATPARQGKRRLSIGTGTGTDAGPSTGGDESTPAEQRRASPEELRPMMRDRMEDVRNAYPLLWFDIPDGRVAKNIGLRASDLPELLVRSLEDHINALRRVAGGQPVRDGPTGQDMFSGVTPQSQKGKNVELHFQVQRVEKHSGKFERLGLTEDTLLGAVMMAVSDVDNRIRAQSIMYAFLYYMTAHGNAAVQRWLDEVGDNILRVHPERRSSATPSFGELFQKREEIARRRAASPDLKVARDNELRKIAQAGVEAAMRQPGPDSRERSSTAAQPDASDEHAPGGASIAAMLPLPPFF